MNTIAIESNGEIATLFLNRPDKRNALNREMCVELRQALRQLDENDGVRIILLRGKGPAFCAGADLAERRDMDEDGLRARRLLAFAAYDAIENAGKPCIAVVEGAAIGAGAEIAAACDFIVATERASFTYPEVALGTVGATQRLPEIIGRRNAKELLFTGRQIDAQEALAMGLASRCFDSQELAAQLEALCAAILAAPGSAVAAAKRCIDDSTRSDKRAALAAEVLSIERMLSDPTWQSRMRRSD
jgi:enoyl-CoA hydratase